MTLSHNQVLNRVCNMKQDEFSGWFTITFKCACNLIQTILYKKECVYQVHSSVRIMCSNINKLPPNINGKRYCVVARLMPVFLRILIKIISTKIISN